MCGVGAPCSLIDMNRAQNRPSTSRLPCSLAGFIIVMVLRTEMNVYAGAYVCVESQNIDIVCNDFRISVNVNSPGCAYLNFYLNNRNAPGRHNTGDIYDINSSIVDTV